MVRGPSTIIKASSMRGLGSMISKKALEKRLGQMEQFSQEILRIIRKKATERSSFRMDPTTKGSSTITLSMAMEYTSGLIRNGTREVGSITKCMARAF